MNILTQKFPESVTVDGIEVSINADFRAGLRIMLAMEDNGLTGLEKQRILFDNLFLEIPAQFAASPEGLLALAEKANWFLNCGEENKDEGGQRLMSFKKDAGLIYAAFSQTHGIDLQTAEMHWWKFVALLMDLGQDTSFCQLVGLRKRYSKGKLNKYELEAVREMGDMFQIEQMDDRTLEEREASAEFDRQVAEAKERRDKEKVKQ